MVNIPYMVENWRNFFPTLLELRPPKRWVSDTHVHQGHFVFRVYILRSAVGLRRSQVLQVWSSCRVILGKSDTVATRKKYIEFRTSKYDKIWKTSEKTTGKMFSARVVVEWLSPLHHPVILSAFFHLRFVSNSLKHPWAPTLFQLQVPFFLLLQSSLLHL